MKNRHLIIIGGGVAGLAAGCYARASGFHTTVLEHNLALGGVCTAWPRGPYLIDGCIQWLTGGPFAPLYDELGISSRVSLRPIQEWVTYRDVASGLELPITSDLDTLERALFALGPDDGFEIHRLIEGARRFGTLHPPSAPPELATTGERLRDLWAMRGAIGPMMHFHQPIEVWANEHLHSKALRRMLTRLVPPGSSTLVLLMSLGYLEQGYLSRPVGGTRAFRDALIQTYEWLGGEVQLNATVDEVLIKHERAVGVRLADGTILEADAVVSTASLPETALRLLGGRHVDHDTRARLANWKMFDPIVLLTLGVDTALSTVPSHMLVDGLEPFEVGGRSTECFSLRVFHDEPGFAPAGHTVVQAMVPTNYAWWATRGTGYQQEKETVRDLLCAQVEQVLPDLGLHIHMSDVATPLSYWMMARSWRGAFEGWVPTPEALGSHLPKVLPGLHGFYMAGQWVEPGGGVPVALQSGRQAVEILCADWRVPFMRSPALPVRV